MTKRITANHIKLKRAYEPATADDGTRVLIDRLWPRGGINVISVEVKDVLIPAALEDVARRREGDVMQGDRRPQRVWSAALAHTITKPVIAVVMGVSGSGKTTVAALLAAALGCQFQEGDDLHPAANVDKMHGGTPLTDADRLPWLRKIAEEIDGWRARGESGVLTCSALKRSYRDIIIDGRPDVTLVYLKGSYDLIRRRMAARHEHFMPVVLLDSQFRTLQEPTPDEQPIIVDVGARPADIAAEIVHQLEERQGNGSGIESPSRSAAGRETSTGERHRGLERV